MATDWFQHAATNRHVHYPANCDCWNIYTPANEAPWLYRYHALPVTSNPWWDYWLNDSWLIPSPSQPDCAFFNLRVDLLNDRLWQTQFRLYRPISNPNLICAGIIVTHVDGLQIAEYKIDLPCVPFPFGGMPRGTPFTFPVNQWQVVVDGPAVVGPPGFGLVLAPQDCAPGFTWPGPIPGPP